MTRFFLYPYELTVLCQLSSLLSPGAALVLHPGCTGSALLRGGACRGIAVCPFHFLIPSGPTVLPQLSTLFNPETALVLHPGCTGAALPIWRQYVPNQRLSIYSTLVPAAAGALHGPRFSQICCRSSIRESLAVMQYSTARLAGSQILYR